MNDIALNIFKYNRNDIIGSNVSNIMPQIIGDKHDDILLDYLKRKPKRINSDQRLLFGKDANGFMFPVQLQLQKASYSVSDEFIFIAMIRP